MTNCTPTADKPSPCPHEIERDHFRQALKAIKKRVNDDRICCDRGDKHWHLIETIDGVATKALKRPAA